MKQDSQYLLAIDNGTQSIRAIIFDPKGTVIAKSVVEIEPYFSAEPAWAEQDANYYWESLCNACQQLWANNDIDKSLIKGMSITTQRSTMINVDVDGNPLRPAIVWLDQRRQETDDSFPRALRTVFKVLNLEDTLDTFLTSNKARWIAANQPDIWQKTHKYLMLSGFQTFKLTGEFNDSAASQVGYVPFDFKRIKWASSLDWKWKAGPAELRHFPKLIQPGELMGKITASAAAATGIPEGLPVISSGADKACEVLGSGCMHTHMGSLSYGTTATFNQITPKYYELERFIPPFPAAINNHYNVESPIYRGFWMVKWFKDQFGHVETTRAEELNTTPETLFDELLEQTEAGANGLTLQPHWTPGVIYPARESKGTIIGFGDIHTRAHFYRAIIEGIVYELRSGKERVERRSRCKITDIRVSGGGSQSDAIMQITADIFNAPVHRPHTFEASSLGAAINVAVGVGIYPDYETAVQKMTRKGDTFSPNPDNAATYDALYKEVYTPLYKALNPFYRSIRRITGYPK